MSERATSERMRIARIRRYALYEDERERVPAEELPKLPTPDRKDEDAPIESPVEAWWDE